ncbi:hypothetical protein [Acinetobacter zhairhuonensis]|uniref:hypothetical protein n=1 Tax=Acinetobacter sp. A7.4 TaxID=2919921 RepID=UPI001F4FFA0B|nr:hypothetical protein [Acinetobacter sp. A7.4]MCJ8162889.1 hypothetical protein [Acinetobacter sp. A7.4]
MKNKAPNKIIAPIIIAGITFGFLASAYKFIFAAQVKQQQVKEEEDVEEQWF